MRYFWRVAAVHGLLLLILVVVPALTRLVRRNMAPVVVPIEFLVEIPSAPAPGSSSMMLQFSIPAIISFMPGKRAIRSVSIKTSSAPAFP